MLEKLVIKPWIIKLLKLLFSGRRKVDPSLCLYVTENVPAL